MNPTTTTTVDWTPHNKITERCNLQMSLHQQNEKTHQGGEDFCAAKKDKGGTRTIAQNISDIR